MILAYWLFYIAVGLLLVCGFEHTYSVLRDRIDVKASKHNLSIIMWSVGGVTLLINHGPIAFIICPTIVPIVLSHIDLVQHNTHFISWKTILPHAWHMARDWMQTFRRRHNND